ncbi:MAG: endonuclease III [Hydrogenothermaceae bacterium]|nr:endonuclease III [Hydrogenothermaceae bacterium]
MDKVDKIFEILNKEYPKWNAPVIQFMAQNGDDPFKILVSTILSLRTKDEVTAKASERLFKVVKTPQDLLNLSEEEIEKLIYPVGFYRNKAKVLKEVARELIQNYNGKVPDNLEDLLKLKGVGRKTANLVLSAAYKKPAICVDTHVHRIANRVGFVKTKDPHQTEFELMKVIPQKYWQDINKLFVAFGQTICKPIKPKCDECPINDYCEAYKNGSVKSGR